MLEALEYLIEALQSYIATLAIDLKHNQEPIGCDNRDLGRMLKVLGESQFRVIWREVTGGECPEDWLSAFQSATEENEEWYGRSIKYWWNQG